MLGHIYFYVILNVRIELREQNTSSTCQHFMELNVTFQTNQKLKIRQGASWDICLYYPSVEGRKTSLWPVISDFHVIYRVVEMSTFYGIECHLSNQSKAEDETRCILWYVYINYPSVEGRKTCLWPVINVCFMLSIE